MHSDEISTLSLQKTTLEDGRVNKHRSITLHFETNNIMISIYCGLCYDAVANLKLSLPSGFKLAVIFSERISHHYPSFTYEGRVFFRHKAMTRRQ